MRSIRGIALTLGLGLLSSCTLVGGPGSPGGPPSPEPETVDGPSATGEPNTDGSSTGGSLLDTPDAIPRPEAKSRSGNPATYEVFGQEYRVMETSEGYEEEGVASWYGEPFHGRRTSSGETYDMYRMTAAHRHLPLPTYVEVTNLGNGRRVVVKVNDRGPFAHVDERIIDLSYVAALKLGMVGAGTARVSVRALPPAAREGGGG